jgi:hypothetical protein
VAFRLGQLDGGGYRALDDLKAAGEIAAIGAGINLKGMIPRFWSADRSTSSWLPCLIRCSSRRASRSSRCAPHGGSRS